MSEYNIVRLDSKMIKQLYVLYENVYGKKRPENYFDLKYATAFTGQEHIGYLAFAGNDPVAFYGIIPTLVSINGTKVLSAQSCDTMTHPAHRKKGLFLKLADLTFKLAKERGIHFVFGFPNESSYHGFTQQLGFIDIETMNRYTLNFSKTFIERVYRMFKKVPVKEEEEHFIENNLLRQGFDGIVYDEAFFKYKKYNDTFIFGSGTYSYWINKSRNLFIGCISKEKEGTIVEQIERLKKHTKASTATFMISPGTQLDQDLSKHYVAEKGFPVIIKDLTGSYPLTNLKFQFADIDIF